MSSLSIAIAEGNPKTLSLLSEILEGEKGTHIVDKAGNGDDAYDMIIKTKPNAALIDVIMPRMNGTSIMEKVRDEEAMEKNPTFIMITAVGSENVTGDTFRMDADYYVMKPFRKEVALDRVCRTAGYCNKPKGMSLTGIREVKPYEGGLEHMEQDLESDVT